MKDPGAKPAPTKKDTDKGDGVLAEEAIQQTFALPPPPTPRHEGNGFNWPKWYGGNGLKVEGVTSCMG